MCDHEQGCNCQACLMRERNALEAEVERLKSMIRHCDCCGGSWVDGGLQADCHCKEIKRLREALAEIERLPGNTYCGDIARRAWEGKGE